MAAGLSSIFAEVVSSEQEHTLRREKLYKQWLIEIEEQVQQRLCQNQYVPLDSFQLTEAEIVCTPVCPQPATPERSEFVAVVYRANVRYAGFVVPVMWSHCVRRLSCDTLVGVSEDIVTYLCGALLRMSGTVARLTAPGESTPEDTRVDATAAPIRAFLQLPPADSTK